MMPAMTRRTPPDAPDLAPRLTSLAPAPRRTRRHLRPASVVPAAVALGFALVVSACGCQREAARTTPQPGARIAAPAAVDPVAPAAKPAAQARPGGVQADAVAQETLTILERGGVLPPRFAGTEARAAFDRGDWARCASAFAAAGAPSGSASQGGVAWQAAALRLLCVRRAGKPADAAKGFEVLADQGGLLASHARLWAAESWLQAGDPRQAAAAIERIPLQGFSRAKRARRTLAQAQRRLDQPAVDTWKTLLQGRASARDLRDGAAAAIAANDPALAKRWLLRVLAEHPGGKAETEARARLATLGVTDPQLSIAQLQRRLTAAASTHKRKLAIAVADEILARSKPGSAAWCLAGTQRAKVVEIFWLRRKEAAAFYDKLAATCPQDARSAKIWYRAGRRHTNSADQRKAFAHFQRILDKAPKTTLFDDALRWQARILRKWGKDKKADQLLVKALGAGGDMVEYAGWDLVWRRVESRDWRGAIAMADKALARQKPGQTFARKRYNVGRVAYWKGYAQWKLRRTRAATATWVSVVERSPWSWYGMLARHRLAQVKPAAGAAAYRRWRQAKVTVKPLAEAAKPLLADPHLLASIELSRMGLKTSAAAELAAVRWPRSDRDVAMLRAAMYSAVGQTTQAVAATLRDHRFDLSPPESANAARWRLAYPRPKGFAALVDSEAKKRNVDAAFVWSIMRSESRFNPRIQSPVHATGLLQLMLGTAKGVNKRLGEPFTITYANLKTPRVNVPLGVAYMRRLQDVVGAHWALVASSYNAGPGNTKKWLRKRPTAELDTFVEAIPFRENRRYVKGVLTSWSRYRALYGGDPEARLPIDLP